MEDIKGDFFSSSWWWLCLENFVFVKCLVSNAKSWQRTPSVESAWGLSYLYFIMMAQPNGYLPNSCEGVFLISYVKGFIIFLNFVRVYHIIFGA